MISPSLSSSLLNPGGGSMLDSSSSPLSIQARAGMGGWSQVSGIGWATSRYTAAEPGPKVRGMGSALGTGVNAMGLGME